MKITVVGIGNVGYAVSEELSAEGHNVTVIDTNPKKVRNAVDNMDVIGITGNGTYRAVLEEANGMDCDLLIALTGKDEINLLCCLVAKRMGVKETIARVRNSEYNENKDLIENVIGLNMAINPELEAASDILRILRFSAAKNIDIFARGLIDLISFVADDKCRLCNTKIRDFFSGKEEQALVCAVRRGQEIYIPGGDFVFEKGDVIAVLVPRASVSDFFKRVGLPLNPIKNIMIIGGGSVGKHLAESLEKEPVNVTLIEIDPETAQELSYQLPQTNVICGDGTNRSLLLEEGIGDMDAVVCLTDFDEENIVLSLFARSLDNDIKTIARVNKIGFHELMRTLDIGSIVYPKYTTSNRILRHVRARSCKVSSNLETLNRIIDNKVEALEFKVGENSKLVGKALRDMKLKKDTLIACINREGRSFIPHGNDTINIGDLVIIITTTHGISDFDEIKG